MNIAFLSTFYPYRGGIAQFNACLLRALEREHDVSAFNFSRLYPGPLFPGTSQYVRPEDRADRIESRMVLDSINPVSYFRTAREIGTLRPDLLLIGSWMSFFAPAMGTVARRLRSSTRVITILHNVVPHEPRFFDAPFIRFLLRQSHGMVVMNSSSERDLAALGVPPGRHLTIPHPIYSHFGDPVDRAAARERLGIPAGNNVLLFFGLVRPYKGVDLLIRAMSSLDERYSLVIAGETYGSAREYGDLISSSPRRENIRFMNEYIPDAKVADLFSAADACILPYRSATQSGVTSVAYHFDLPVIATDVGGLGEDVGGRGTGLVVGPPEPEVIAAGIRRYFDEGMRDRCVVNIAAVKREESWERYAERLTAFAGTLPPL